MVVNVNMVDDRLGMQGAHEILHWEKGGEWDLLLGDGDNVDGAAHAKMVEGGRVDALWRGCEWVASWEIEVCFN